MGGNTGEDVCFSFTQALLDPTEESMGLAPLPLNLRLTFSETFQTCACYGRRDGQCVVVDIWISTLEAFFGNLSYGA